MLLYKVTLAGLSGCTWILGGELGSALPATTQLEVWNAYLARTTVTLAQLEIKKAHVVLFTDQPI